MAFYGSAKGASFEDQIRMLHTAEVKGSEEYYVLIAQAREHGLNDLADAMCRPTRTKTRRTAAVTLPCSAKA